MNWDAMGAVAELLGAIAVFVTIVYLTVQVRQNAKALKQQNELAQAQAMQARTDTQINMISFFMSDPKYLDSAMAVMASINDPMNTRVSEGQKRTAEIALSVMRTTMENTFVQFKKGFLTEEFYEGITVQSIATFGPMLLALDLWMSPDFKEEVKRIVRENNG